MRILYSHLSLEVRRMLSQPCSILSQSVAGLGILRGRAWQHGLEQYRLRMQSARSGSPFGNYKYDLQPVCLIKHNPEP